MSTKDLVLAILEKSKGSFVSSRSIVKDAGVSRNAVWKAVNELRKIGYDIDSVTNKGYCLKESSDVISIPAITAFLKKRDMADKILICDELPSTNRTAKIEWITGESHKRIVIARRQTDGVGHSSEKYRSPEGGIYLSIIRTPEELGQKKLKSSAIGKAVSGVIEELTGFETELKKETNRIYVKGKKVCGILTEYIADLETGEVSCYIIGVGVKMKGIQKNEMIAHIIDAIYEI